MTMGPSGCGSDEPDNDPAIASGAGGGGVGGMGTGGAGAGMPVFGPCPDGYRTECALLNTPLDHEAPKGETIELHVAREPALEGPGDRQLWLLSGGPGQAGHIFERLVRRLHDTLPTTDVYVIDHRGTGYSHRLTCPQQDVPNTSGGYALDPVQVPSCLADLDARGETARLPYFTTQQAARDVALAIAATRRPDQKVFVWGGSYGTHWAHRVVQVAAASVDGFVFDGYMTPHHFSFVHYDEGIEEVGTLFAAGCAADIECSARMGNSPLDEVRTIYEEVDASPCGALDRELTRAWASILMDSSDLQPLVFPFLHRVRRCEPSDYAPINHLITKVNALFTDGETELFLNSGVLQYNIALSELWTLPGEPSPTQEELEGAAAAQVFLAGQSYPARVAPLRKLWPLPPDDSASLPVPVPTDTPMLWLAGGMDTRTPPSQAALAATLYEHPSQQVVLLEAAGHTPSRRSVMDTDEPRYCGLEIIEGFVADGVVDASCEKSMKPIAYASPDEAFAIEWWGVADDWGDQATTATSGASSELPRRGPEHLPPLPRHALFSTPPFRRAEPELTSDDR